MNGQRFLVLHLPTLTTDRIRQRDRRPADLFIARGTPGYIRSDNVLYREAAERFSLTRSGAY